MRRSELRIGHGYDVHAFGSGDAVVLGGIRIPHDRGLVARSDGDVVIHALCDAMLGAAGLGDIGRLFPETDPDNAGRDSREFLTRVAEAVREEGLRLGNADITVVAEAPRISGRIGAMREALAAVLKIEPGRLNIKATTHEGLGALGNAEGIAAHAVVLLETLA